MKRPIRCTTLLLLVASLPLGAGAALIDLSDVELVASTITITQALPAEIDFDVKTVPQSSLVQAEALSLAAGIPFPNLPNSQNQAFASSAVDTGGVFGVGVNGFFFRNSLPPNTLEASGAFSQSITNNSTVTVPVVVDFFIPIPTIQLFGVGNFFPPGADPALDVQAGLSVKMRTTVTHPDGSFVENLALDYGLTLFREPVSSVLLAIPSRDAVGSVSAFVEFDGSFGFVLTSLQLDDFALGDIGPGDVMRFSYDFTASASTGFGETGVFAAIGDPFNLRASGVRFDLQVGAVSVPVPEPATYALFAAALLVVGLRLHAGRR